MTPSSISYLTSSIQQQCLSSQHILLEPKSDGNSLQITFSTGKVLELKRASLIKAIVQRILPNSQLTQPFQVPIQTFFGQSITPQGEAFFQRYCEVVEQEKLPLVISKYSTFQQQLKLLKTYIIVATKLEHISTHHTCDRLLARLYAKEAHANTNTDNSITQHAFLLHQLLFATNYKLEKYANTLIHSCLERAPQSFEQDPGLSPARLALIQEYGSYLTTVDDSISNILHSNSKIIQYFPNISCIKLTTSSLAQINIPSSSTSLCFKNNQSITAEELQQVFNTCPHIVKIDLENSPLSLVNIQFPPTTEILNLAYTELDDATLTDVLGQLTLLEELDISYTSCSLRHTSTVILPETLLQIDLEGCLNIKPLIFKEAVRNCVYLEYINIGSTLLSIATLPQLPALGQIAARQLSSVNDNELNAFLLLHPNIMHIDLTGTDVRLQNICFPNTLQTLCLADCLLLDDKDFSRALEVATNLTEVDISNSSLTLEDHPPFGPNLIHLDVSSTQVRDTTLQIVLSKSPLLKKLSVKNTLVSLTGVITTNTLQHLYADACPNITPAVIQAITTQCPDVTIS